MEVALSIAAVVVLFGLGFWLIRKVKNRGSGANAPASTPPPAQPTAPVDQNDQTPPPPPPAPPVQ